MSSISDEFAEWWMNGRTEAIHGTLAETTKKSYNEKIRETVKSIEKLLIEKNTAYGDSVFKPVSVFGENIKPSVAIKARIADKLSRIQNKGLNDKTEDSLDDLIGYLIILKIILKEENED